MSFRNWLLTGTSLTLLALLPLGAARAQDASDPALVAAYQAYTAEQTDETKQKLTEACITAGFASLDDCIAALAGQTPVDQPSSEPVAAPEASSEVVAPEEPSSEAPAPSSEEVAPVEPSSEVAPVEPSSEAAPAPSSEDVAPVEPSSEVVAPAEPSSEEAAPVAPSSEEVAPVAPSSEEAAPAAPSSEEPAPAPAEPTDALGQLTAAVDAYNAAAAKVDAGDAAARADADAAKAQIDKICLDAGFADTESCLAQAGLTLNPLPPMASSEQPVTSSEQPISDMPAASEPVDPNAVEPLPADVADEAAPILDSEKDTTNASSDASQPSDQPSSEEPAPAAPTPPPENDQAAQQDIQPPAEQQSADTEVGDNKTPDFTFTDLTPPPENSDVKIVDTPKTDKGGFVFQIGVNIFINNPTQERDRFYDATRGDTIYYEDLSRGRTREVITRRDGSRVVTIYDRYGDVLARSKFTPDGREIYLSSYYGSQDTDENGFWIDPGRDLPPLRLTIPASEYILDADTADADQVEFFLDQPPVEKVRRIYSIDEVKRSARIRDSVRRLEVGGLTFDTGKATIARDQVDELSTVAKAMLKLLAKNEGEVFLIEGHTDAVGSDVSNLVLSDERAATVARILTDFYEIPAENLVTQGYGERYLKVKTEGDERLNRRVTIKRITPLVTYEAAAN